MRSLLIFILLLFCITTKSQTGLGDFKLNKTKVDFVISKHPAFYEVTDSSDYPLIRRFDCNEYKMLDISVINIKLVFCDDTLISFQCDRDPLIENYLYSKYGKPQFKKEKQTINVNNFKYNEEIVSFKWIDDRIITTSTYTRHFNLYFNVVVNSYFNIYIEEKIKNCNGNKN